MKENSKYNFIFNLSLFTIIYIAETYLVYRFILNDDLFIILAIICYPIIVYFYNKRFEAFGKNRFL